MDRARRLEQWDHTSHILAMIAASGGVDADPAEFNPIRQEDRRRGPRKLVKPSELEM